MALVLGTQIAYAGEAGEMQTDRQIQILETYVNIRDGVAPADNVVPMLRAFNRYRTSFGNVEDDAAEWSSSANCTRYKNLYDEIGNQLVQYYGLLLNTNSLAPATRENVEGRLYTLKLFEMALFSLAVTGKEGGISMIDPLEKHYCVVKGREHWLSAMSRAHQDLQRLHETVFGYRSAMDFRNASDIVQRLNAKIEHRGRIERYAYNIAEFGLSILVWFKGVAPLLRRARTSIESPPLRAATTIAAGIAYTLAFMKLDQEAYAHFSFLQPKPTLKEMSLLRWNDLMSRGEEVVNSKLESTPLYFAYLKLTALLDRETAYNFLLEHQEFLSEMETQYGSINAALNHLKEERENETNNKRAG